MSFKNSPFLLVLSFIVLAIFFYRVQPLIATDIYYHLSVGREVSQTHQIPAKDTFVYGSANTKYISTEWLSGLIFYYLVSLLGFNSLYIPQILCGLITIYFFYRSLKVLKINSLIISTSVLFLGYILPFRLNARPEMFSLAFLSIINFVCIFFYFKKKIPFTAYSLPFIFLLWPNLHGFSPLGIVLFSFFTFLFLFKEENKDKLYEKYTLCGIYIIIVTVSFLQIQRLLSFTHTNEFSQYIIEWLSLWDRIFPKGLFIYRVQGITFDIYIFLLLFVLYVFLIIKNKAISLISIFSFITLLLPFRFYRLITPIAIIVLPYFIFLFTSSIKKFSENNRYVGSTYIFLFLVILYSSLIGHQIGGEEREAIYPYKGMEFIRNNLESKRIFAFSQWDDYFIWNIPKIKTFADVMTQYRTLKDLQDEQILHSPEHTVETLLKKYDIDTVVNTQPESSSRIGTSLTPVYKLSNWELVYVDNISAIYRRKDVGGKEPFNLSFIHPEFDTPHKYKLEEEEEAVKQLKELLKFDSKNDFVRSQLLFYYFIRLNDIHTAKSFAEESRTLNPENPFYSFILAAVHLRLNDCQQAKYYAEEVLKKNIYDSELKKTTYQILNMCNSKVN